MLQAVFSYILDVIVQAVRMSLAVLFAALLNLLLFSADTMSLAMFRDTGMGGQFSQQHPALFGMLNRVVELVPYWQSSLQLAFVAVCGTLAVAVLAQFLGLRRLLFDPLPVLLKALCALLLAVLMAAPLAHYDGRLAYLDYVWLLFPGTACVLLPVVTASRELVPDMSEFVA